MMRTDFDSSQNPLVHVTHGANVGAFPVAGKSVGSVRKGLVHHFSIPAAAIAFVGGRIVGPDHIIVAGQDLTFAKPTGQKGVGTQVWTEDEFCKCFKIPSEELQAWTAQGLKVKQCLDGSIRITETAVDEFFRGKEIESPYLTAEEAAKYLRTTVKGIYSLMERRKLKKLPGLRNLLFTREALDDFLRGGRK